MGKKILRIALIVLAVVLIVAILAGVAFFGVLFAAVFSACENSGTSLGGDDTPKASVLLEEEGDYLSITLYETSAKYLFDTEENRLIQVNPTNLTYVYQTILEGDVLEQYGFVSIPVYDKNTGIESHREYYRTMLRIDCKTGLETDREVDDVAMTEAEAIAFFEENASQNEVLPAFVGIERVANFILTNSSSYARENEEPLDVESLGDTEKAIYHYALGLRESDVDRFYWIGTSARRMNSEVWFFSTVCDKKSWGGQRPIMSGLNSSRLVRYNELTNSFTTVLELGEGCVILGFDDTYAIFYENGALMRVNHQTGERVTLMESASELYATGSEELLFLEYYGGEQNRLIVMKYDGTVVYEN